MTHTVFLTRSGPNFSDVIRTLRIVNPTLTIGSAMAIIKGPKPVEIAQTEPARALTIARDIFNLGGSAVVEDENGELVEMDQEQSEFDMEIAPIQWDPVTKLAASRVAKEVRDRQLREQLEAARDTQRLREEARIAREMALSPELATYARFVISSYGQDKTDGLEQWCSENLQGLYRFRKVQANMVSPYAVETTTVIDSLFVKMRWQEVFLELPESSDEWIWGSPSRLFGDNLPSLAFEIGRGEYLHPSGVPYSFAGILAVEETEQPVEPEAMKANIMAVAPNEAQRELFVRFCEEHEVAVHYVSAPFHDSLVDDVLFNSIVSIDDGESLDTFKAVWSSAFERFSRDTQTKSILALNQLTERG